MSVLKSFIGFLIGLRFFEALFLSGIPSFAYLVFSDIFEISNFVLLYVSSLFCALSVFGLGEFFVSGKKFFASICFLFISSILLIGRGIYVILFPVFIFFNWFFYYFSRRFIILADIFLHFLGGILQFYFGVLFCGYTAIFSLVVFALALGVSLAFTAGYMVDLIQDVEEDKTLKQKNITVVLGEKIVFLASFFLFVFAYIIMYDFITGSSISFLFLMIFFLHIILALSVFVNFSRKFIHLYRMSYRVIFPVSCILVFLSRLRVEQIH